MHDKGQVFFTQNGGVDKLCAIRLDVSAQKWIEAELEVDATIIEHASKGIAIFYSKMNITRCNKALKETLKNLADAKPASNLQNLLSMLQSNPNNGILSSLAKEGHWRGEIFEPSRWYTVKSQPN